MQGVFKQWECLFQVFYFFCWKSVCNKYFFEPFCVCHHFVTKRSDAFQVFSYISNPVGQGKANYWHTGSLPGTATLLVRRADGLSWAALFNQRSDDKKLPDSALDAALHRAAAEVGDWPVQDLFSSG